MNNKYDFKDNVFCVKDLKFKKVLFLKKNKVIIKRFYFNSVKILADSKIKILDFFAMTKKKIVSYKISNKYNAIYNKYVLKKNQDLLDIQNKAEMHRGVYIGGKNIDFEKNLFQNICYKTHGISKYHDEIISNNVKSEIVSIPTIKVPEYVLPDGFILNRQGLVHRFKLVENEDFINNVFLFDVKKDKEYCEYILNLERQVMDKFYVKNVTFLYDLNGNLSFISNEYITLNKDGIIIDIDYSKIITIDPILINKFNLNLIEDSKTEKIIAISTLRKERIHKDYTDSIKGLLKD